MRAALGLDRARAARAVEILTFDGSFRDDLWHKPLIPLEGSWLTIVFEALRTPNLLWLVDRWLRDGKFDMAARGGIFEGRLREALIEACRLDNAAVLPHALKLPLENGAEEDIDVAVRVGQTVLIGEPKCTVYPTEPHEYRSYEETLRGEASQAVRKAQAARDNPRALIEASGWTDLEADALRVVPCVISNLPLGTGYPVGDTPVADEYILARHLNEGGVAQYVIQGPDTAPMVGQFTRFYSSPEEAAANLAGYLAAPPQYEVLHQSVIVERQGLIYFAGERPAQYTLYRVVPHWPGTEGGGST